MTIPKHAPRVPFALLIGGLLIGGMSLLLLLNTASAANEVHRHDVATQDESVAAQVQELQNEVAASAAPQNLAAAAAALGMVPALNPAFLVVGPDGAVKVMGKPAPASPAYIPPPATPTHTATATDTSTATTTATATSSKSADAPHGAHDTDTSTSSTPTLTPSPTPTPTVTLPGGNR
jgi:hypothetical protein